MTDIIEGVPTPDEYAEQGYRLKPLDPADRYRRQHEVWRNQVPTIARGLVAVDPVESAAFGLLVGGMWLPGPFYPAAVSPGGSGRTWVSDTGIVVHEEQVQARSVGSSTKLDAWRKYMDAEPELDCPGSGYVALDHEGDPVPEGAADIWCPECEHTVPVVRDDTREEPLIQARHDKRGRPVD